MSVKGKNFFGTATVTITGSRLSLMNADTNMVVMEDTMVAIIAQLDDVTNTVVGAVTTMIEMNTTVIVVVGVVVTEMTTTVANDTVMVTDATTEMTKAQATAGNNQCQMIHGKF